MVVEHNSKRLTIAIQKSGRLSKESIALLEACGFKFSLHEARLLAHSHNQPVDLLRVGDDHIPGLIMDGVVHLGIVGENVLEEVRLERQATQRPNTIHKLRALDFGQCPSHRTYSRNHPSAHVRYDLPAHRCLETGAAFAKGAAAYGSHGRACAFRAGHL